MKRFLLSLLAVFASLPFLTSCDDDSNNQPSNPTVPGVTLAQSATSQTLWTGVAVLQDGRIFANFPRMDTDTVPYSVAEIRPGAAAVPFPDTTWNNWKPSLSARNRFVCVQSVYTDANNFLWVLDAASPLMRGVVPGGAKLLKFDPNTRQLLQRIDFDETVAYPTSYLNDVRVDTQNNVAYLTDSNQGAIIVVNLNTNRARRLLGNHPSTKSENLILTVEGRIWRNRSGQLPSLDSDGLALSPDRDYLYYHALTARTLYRILTAALRDESLTAAQLGQRVEVVADSGPTDGMIFDAAGNLYFTSMQLNAVTRLTPQGQFQLVAQDPQLKWPRWCAIRHHLAAPYSTHSAYRAVPDFQDYTAAAVIGLE